MASGVDSAAIPFCQEQLSSPVLHKTLLDIDVAPLVYEEREVSEVHELNKFIGARAWNVASRSITDLITICNCDTCIFVVGSQGDGSVQFVAKNRECALMLMEVLKRKLGTEAHLVTLGSENDYPCKPQSQPAKRPKAAYGNKICTAVIPAAGFGTRLFPASRGIRRKALFPIVDKDGFAKPLLLCLVEECVQAGLQRIIIVVGPGDQEEKVREIFAPVPKALYDALKPHMREYGDRIAKLEQMIKIAIQPEPKGFGHAVVCAGVEDGSPFVLLLGDVFFKSRDESRSCLQQAIDAFHADPSKSVVGVIQVPLSESRQYGVVKTYEDIKESGKSAAIEKIVEKPDACEAEECSRNGMCDVLLGLYVFTASLMTQLRKDAFSNRMEGGEIQLTSAMILVRSLEGTKAVRLNGDPLDASNAKEYTRTISKLSLILSPSEVEL